MTLFGNLLTTILPRVRHPDSPTFHSLTQETARYAGGLEDYRPYRADHEHPSKTSTWQRAELVFRQVMAVEASRIAEVTRFLESRGLQVGPAPAHWNAIGDWLETRIEGSREPGSDRRLPYLHDQDGGLERRAASAVGGESTTVLRPVLNSLAFDLSLLLGRHMIQCGRPRGRWARVAAD